MSFLWDVFSAMNIVDLANFSQVGRPNSIVPEMRLTPPTLQKGHPKGDSEKDVIVDLPKIRSTIEYGQSEGDESPLRTRLVKKIQQESWENNLRSQMTTIKEMRAMVAMKLKSEQWWRQNSDSEEDDDSEDGVEDREASEQSYDIASPETNKKGHKGDVNATATQWKT
ncbi:hypothetical protein BJ742DRAFT_440838 [Cladochytrium replicatum]|nr:hypothetical protein BJ742DRAFT_440838 [Cladochytrium replicatum]